VSGHTPGPWVFDAESATVLGLGYVGPRDREVCAINPSVTYGVDSANARLIESAPDLLDALRACVEDMDKMAAAGLQMPVICRMQARAAIAKAEGK
jgi:hypothetical protein